MLHNMTKMMLQVVIIDRGQGLELIKKNNNVLFNFMCLGRGTASSHILEYLGLCENEKDIVFSIVEEGNNDILNNISKLKNNDRCISFMISISSINSVISNRRLNGGGSKRMDMNRVSGNEGKLYDLVITIIDSGYSEEVMNCAKNNGATGGTVLHARGSGEKEAEKFMGITIQPEKEVVLILINHNIKHDLMIAITSELELNTEGNGICFSIPVNSVQGIKEKNIHL